MEALLNPVQAGLLLGKSHEALNHMRVRNTGPSSLKIGGRIFYTPSAIQDFAARKGITLAAPQASTETLVSA